MVCVQFFAERRRADAFPSAHEHILSVDPLGRVEVVPLQRYFSASAKTLTAVTTPTLTHLLLFRDLVHSFPNAMQMVAAADALDITDCDFPPCKTSHHVEQLRVLRSTLHFNTS